MLLCEQANGCMIVCWPPDNTVDAKRHIYGEGENVSALYTNNNTNNNTTSRNSIRLQHGIYQDSNYDAYNDTADYTAADNAVAVETAGQYNNYDAAAVNTNSDYEYNSHDYKISTNNVISGLPVLQPSSDTYDTAYDDYNINPGMCVKNLTLSVMH
jgi:hypothetical protein